MLHFSVRYAENSSHHDKKPFAKIRCLYNYNLCKATYKGLERLQPNKRHFIIARGGFVGVHRYAGLWTGLMKTPQITNNTCEPDINPAQ